MDVQRDVYLRVRRAVMVDGKRIRCSSVMECKRDRHSPVPGVGDTGVLVSFRLGATITGAEADPAPPRSTQGRDLLPASGVFASEGRG